MPIILFFLLVLSAVVPAFAAEDCSSVDLDSDPQILGRVPIWDQGDTHVCPSFAAAQIIDAYRFQKGDRDFSHLTSPVGLAARTIETYAQRGSSYQGGKIAQAFHTAKSRGTCNAKALSDHLGSKTTQQIIEGLSVCHQTAAHDKQKAIQQCQRFFAETGLPIESIPTANVLSELLMEPKEKFMSQVLSPFCQDNKNLEDLPNVKVWAQPRYPIREIQTRMHQLLTDKIPMAINFCSEAAVNRGHVGYHNGKEWVCQRKSHHSAVIAGRKMIHGRCHVLIRDTGCRTYRKVGICQQGRLWIEEQHLLRNTEGIIWLE